jgi:hypothetical protein
MPYSFVIVVLLFAQLYTLVLIQFPTKTQNHSTQCERDRLFGGHRRTFRPFQPKYDVSKLSV